jgi:hypothetical protein
VDGRSQAEPAIPSRLEGPSWLTRIRSVRVTDTHITCYKQLLDAQSHSYQQPEQLINILTQVLQRLPMCRYLAINDGFDWQPWGHLTLFKALATNLDWMMESRDSWDCVMSILSIVLQAVCRSNMNLDCLSIVPYLGQVCGIEPEMLLAPSLQDAEPQQSILDISELQLRLDPVEPDAMHIESNGWEDDFVRFITSFPNIMDLSLSFIVPDRLNRFNSISGRLHIPLLRDLSLDSICCNKVDIMRTFQQHSQTLNCIQLDNITLGDKTDDWQDIFRFAQNNLKLTNVSISECGVRENDQIGIKQCPTAPFLTRFVVCEGYLSYSQVIYSLISRPR